MRRPEVRTFWSPDSSNISNVVYSTEDSHLFVKFRNGSTYWYADVPVDVYVSLLEAQSVGKAFNELVRGKFEYGQN